MLLWPCSLAAQLYPVFLSCGMKRASGQNLQLMHASGGGLCAGGGSRGPGSRQQGMRHTASEPMLGFCDGWSAATDTAAYTFHPLSIYCRTTMRQSSQHTRRISPLAQAKSGLASTRWNSAAYWCALVVQADQGIHISMAKRTQTSLYLCNRWIFPTAPASQLAARIWILSCCSILASEGERGTSMHVCREMQMWRSALRVLRPVPDGRFWMGNCAAVKTPTTTTILPQIQQL